jgi:hypothetical protein
MPSADTPDAELEARRALADIYRLLLERARRRRLTGGGSGRDRHLQVQLQELGDLRVNR